jgi:hypothetical protein
MMDFNAFEQWFSENFFGDQNMFRDISIIPGSWVCGHVNTDIPTVLVFAPFPYRTARTKIIFQSVVVTFNEFSRFSFDSTLGSAIIGENCCFTATPAMAESIWNFRGIRGTFRIVHEAYSCKVSDWIRAVEAFQRFTGSFFYSISGMGLQY